MIPKTRLDALTDGVFAFAMTLLVLNLALPEGFRPANDGDLVAALRDLNGPLIAYVVSFFVLGLRWMGQARTKEDPEIGSAAYAWAVLFHLFFITLLPFSTMLVGRYDDFAAAIWIYAANMVASSLAAIRISILAERETGHRPEHTGRIDLTVLAASALLSVAISFVSPKLAMWAYLLNVASPFVRKWTGRS